MPSSPGSGGFSRPGAMGAAVVLAPVAAVLVYALSVYGTVAPCGILEQEIMARTEAAADRQSDDGSLLEQGAQAAGLALGEDALESRLEDYSSLECAEFMWRAKTGEFSDVREALQ